MSVLVINDEQMCTEGGQTYKEEPYPERRISFMAEQHSYINNKAVLVNVVSTDEINWADQTYTKHGENSGSAEQIWQYSVDPHEKGAYAEDYHGSMSSLTASILTSGYGSYKPDYPNDDLDVVHVRDDCSLFEFVFDTKYLDACYTKEDPNLSLYRDHLSSEVAEQQIPPLSLNGGDRTPFPSFPAGENTVYNYTDSFQGTTDENRLRSTSICPEDFQTLSLSADSVDFSANEVKCANVVHLQVTSMKNRHVAYCSEDWEDVETFCTCNKDLVNIRLHKYITTMKVHR